MLDVFTWITSIVILSRYEPHETYMYAMTTLTTLRSLKKGNVHAFDCAFSGGD